MSNFERSVGFIASIITIVGFVVSAVLSNPDRGPAVQLTGPTLLFGESFTLTIFAILVTSILAATLFAKTMSFASLAVPQFTSLGQRFSMVAVHPIVGFISGYQSAFINSIIFPIWSESWITIVVFVLFCAFCLFLETIFIMIFFQREELSALNEYRVAAISALFFAISITSYILDIRDFTNFSSYALMFGFVGLMSVISAFAGIIVSENL